jgi:hypothetical protein
MIGFLLLDWQEVGFCAFFLLSSFILGYIVLRALEWVVGYLFEE